MKTAIWNTETDLNQFEDYTVLYADNRVVSIVPVHRDWRYGAKLQNGTGTNCPNCGAPLGYLAIKCEYCDTYFNGG